jgi:hypothetical protein
MGLLSVLRRLWTRPATLPVTHTLVCGVSRSGKSEAELSRLVPLAERNDCSIVLLDPPGTLAEKFLLHLRARGLDARVLYDRLADTDRVPGYDWLLGSTNPDPLQREAENDERIREFAAILLRRRGIQDPAATPVIEEGLLAALRLYLAQATPLPLPRLAGVFDHRSDAHASLLARCTDPALVRKFQAYAALSPTARRTEVAPAERILRGVCTSPPFRVRSGEATFDLGQFLDGRGILILDGSSRGNLSRDAASVMMGAVILRVIQHCRTGAKSKVVLVLDEAVSAGLIGVHESQALSEAGKWGLEFHILIQNPFSFPSDEIRGNVLQNCWRHEWFRQGSPEAARLAAEDIAIPLLDPLRIHHTEYRVRSRDAGYERVQAEARSETFGRHGETTGRSASWRTVLWPRRSEVTDAQRRYTALTDQILLVQKKLMRLRPGYRFVRCDRITPVPEYVPMLRSPTLAFGGEQRISGRGGATNRVLQAMKRRPEYRSTTDAVPPGQPAPSETGAARALDGGGPPPAARDVGTDRAMGEGNSV